MYRRDEGPDFKRLRSVEMRLKLCLITPLKKKSNIFYHVGIQIWCIIIKLNMLYHELKNFEFWSFSWTSAMVRENSERSRCFVDNEGVKCVVCITVNCVSGYTAFKMVEVFVLSMPLHPLILCTFRYTDQYRKMPKVVRLDLVGDS